MEYIADSSSDEDLLEDSDKEKTEKRSNKRKKRGDEENEEEKQPDENEGEEQPTEEEAVDEAVQEAVAAVVAGVYPSATEAQRRALRKALHEHGNAVLVVLEQWKSGTTQQQMDAQMAFGFFHLNSLDRDGEYIPKNAPPSLSYLFNANQRDKLKRLAKTVKDKYAQDFWCRSNWPKFDGFLVHVNEVKANRTGNEYSNPALKKRIKTQVCVLGATHEALERFDQAFNPQIDLEAYTIYRTTDPMGFAEKVHEQEP